MAWQRAVLAGLVLAACAPPAAQYTVVQPPSGARVYDNPWNVPFEARVAPGVGVRAVRAARDRGWDVELDVGLDGARYEQVLVASPAALGDLPPGGALGPAVRAAVPAAVPGDAQAAPAGAWLLVCLEPGDVFGLEPAEVVSSGPASVQLSAALLGSTAQNSSRVLVHAFFADPAEFDAAVDVVFTLLSYHRDAELGALLDVAHSASARLFPSVFEQQPVTLTVTVAQERSFVLDYHARVLLARAANASVTDAPVALLELTLVASRGVAAVAVLSAAHAQQPYLPAHTSSSQGPAGAGGADGAAPSEGAEWALGNMSAWSPFCASPLPAVNTTDSCTRGALFACGHQLPSIRASDSELSTAPMPVRVVFQMLYSDALAQGRTRLLVRFALEGNTTDGQRLASELNAAVELPHSVQRCGADVHIPAPAPEFERVEQRVYMGGALTPLEPDASPPDGAPPTRVFSVAEVQQFALLDGLVTLALLGKDDFFTPGAASSVSLGHLLVVRVRSEPAYGKLRAMIALGLAYRADPATLEITLADDFAAVCGDPLARCVVADAWAGGAARDPQIVLRVVPGEAGMDAFVDAVPPAQARGTPTALAARVAFTDTLLSTLQPDSTKRAVYLINTRELSAAPGDGVEYVLLLSSYRVQ
jgi:hypothetical protein